MAVKQLSTTDHDRGSAGLQYVYPVVSRRAGGVSVGINLNPNNACNFRCIYCQIPNLTAGKSPPIDCARLATELHDLLADLVYGDFLTTRVPAGARQLRDIAISGNGEPTSSPQLAQVIEQIDKVTGRLGSDLPPLPVILITNGSLLLKAAVQQGVSRLAALGGELWFKMDSVTAAGIRRINGSAISPAGQLERLVAAAQLCPTRIQTCMFSHHGQPPPPAETQAYLQRVRRLLDDGVPIKGVLLYNLARPSEQPEAETLAPLPASWLEDFGGAIERCGLPVRVTT